MKNEAHVDIERPIEEVFDYTNHKIADWSTTVVAVEDLSETPEGVGSRSKVVTVDGARRMDFECVTTVWDPPHASAVQMTGKHFDIEAHYAFEEIDGSTRVTQRSDVQGKGFTGVIFFLFGWLMHKKGCEAVQDELKGLKSKLESGAGAGATVD